MHSFYSDKQRSAEQCATYPSNYTVSKPRNQPFLYTIWNHTKAKKSVLEKNPKVSIDL